MPAAAALALGFWGIRRQDSLWSDEAVTYEVAHRSTSDIARLLAEADVVHGLHYFLMHAVFALWEGGTVALRLPSVLAVAATAAGVGLLGRRLAGPRAGLFAGLVLALLPSLQRYAQEGRSYALVCALMTLSLIHRDRASGGHGSERSSSGAGSDGRDTGPSCWWRAWCTPSPSWAWSPTASPRPSPGPGSAPGPRPRPS
nr:glycosyltransferase family 39 protein [Streptomyces californicus]